jgi:hypothetical protein
MVAVSLGIEEELDHLAPDFLEAPIVIECLAVARARDVDPDRRAQRCARTGTERDNTIGEINAFIGIIGDEGIYLADRIIPLSSGPGATLGPSIRIDIPRPRDRKALNHDRRFKQIRREVIEFLLNSKGRHHASVSRKLVLPDLQPEDLNVPRAMMGGRRRPIRRSEIKRETVEVDGNV